MCSGVTFMLYDLKKSQFTYSHGKIENFEFITFVNHPHPPLYPLINYFITLPVLEAAHIKPYSQSGPHFIANSLLLRSDLHKLFDFGYLTLTKELKIEVSRRIKVEFENGKDYYRYHGLPIANLPGKAENIPSPIYLDWHNQKCFKG